MTDAFLWRNIVGTLGFIYIFEFKQDEQSENAWCQIKKKAGFSKLGPAF